ncbi:MAG TPA: PorP/SprF family type IX secretion system membrane protein [Bacteroidales bacterium]|nr:PorP/SprF family type IX secretion system membrane protein [Bacteroidales bacterium]
MKYIVYIVLCCVSFQKLSAQDPQFTHLYAIPLYVGPSFAGATGGTRATLNARDQWTAVKKEYVSYSLGADHFVDEINSGIGLLVFRDHSGYGNLTQTFAALQYSYSLNVSKFMSIRPGIQASYSQRKIDYSKLLFGDQLSIFEIKDETIEPQLIDKTSYLDFTASMLGIYKNFWFGYTLDHILRPNQSLLASKTRVPLRSVYYAGAKFQVKIKVGNKSTRGFLYTFAHYNKQENFNQALVGAYLSQGRFITGVWYRGIPFLKAYDEYINTDAFAFMFGLKQGYFTYLYSYDLTASKLTSDSAGSHEITIVWNWKSEKTRKQKMKALPCPMHDNPWKKNESQTM